MNSLQKILPIAGFVLLSACAPECENLSTELAADEGEKPGAAFWRESYLMLGKETYERSCASCHAEGRDGAPRTGDQESWSNRSSLWSAVLLEHAKNGYLGMPARGGHPELTERAVEAAGEYMLGETFPELPVD